MRSLAVLLAVGFLCFASPARAQISAGAHYSALALEYPDQTRSGAGAFVVYSPRPWIGLDAATSVFLSEEPGGVAWQVLAGPRIGTEVAGLRVYGRVRPGFIRFSRRFYSPDIVCIAIFPPPESCLATAMNFALDVGGTVETEVTPAAFLRFDLGDQLTRYGRGDGGSDGRGDGGAAWMHGLQFTAGIGWRF